MTETETRSELESRIGYTFRDAELLKEALTHSSYANEQGEGSCSNERLEFLGDAVTGLEAALLIFENGPGLNEGQMTAARASLVGAEGLSSIARSIELGKHLYLGVGAEKTGIRENESVLEDAFEALVGAVFLDGGTEAARGVLRNLFKETTPGILGADYKSRLQEELQKKGATDINYIIKEDSGPDHDKWFRVAVEAGGRELGEGTGKTKKNAEKMAAKMALEELKCI